MSKLQKLRAQFDALQIDALLITSELNRTYMTEFKGSAGFVIITKDQANLYVDSRYIEQAQKDAVSYDVTLLNGSPFTPKLQAILKELNVEKLGFEEQHLSFYEYNLLINSCDAELIPTSNAVEKLRTLKTEEELAILRKAAEISDAAFTHILTFIREGVTELEIANELEMKMRSLGATSSSFDMIVASGERSSLPHGGPTEKKIEKGDFVTLDFGALYKGYRSDMTRTIAVGEPSDKLKEIYEIVLKAQVNAVENIKAGMTGGEVDALTSDIIKEAGYGEFYGHSTGHGIGLYIHEDIFLHSTSKEIVEPGMVLTIEPGIYLPNIGGVRIEDDVIIGEYGNEIITKSPKQLIIV